jgi:hypothetical protein
MLRTQLAIEGVWLIKERGDEGKIRVLVEVEGDLHEAITEVADDGRISHHVHPAGILAAPVVQL